MLQKLANVCKKCAKIVQKLAQTFTFLQPITTRRVVRFNDVTHGNKKIISICPANFLAGYFAEAPQVFAELTLSCVILHLRTPTRTSNNSRFFLVKKQMNISVCS